MIPEMPGYAFLLQDDDPVIPASSNNLLCLEHSKEYNVLMGPFTAQEPGRQPVSHMHASLDRNPLENMFVDVPPVQ